MALTEEQREVALRAWQEVATSTSVGESIALKFAARFLAALPKPEPYAVVNANDDSCWADILPDRNVKIGQLLYAEAPIAPPASEQKPAALPFAIFDQEITDLRRFHECAMDDEGYDVPKDRMKRLAEIGLVRRVSANYYEHTDFGLSVLNGDFDSQPQTDYKAQRDAERYRWLCEYLIGPRCDLDDTIISCASKNDMDGVIDAAIASVKGGA